MTEKINKNSLAYTLEIEEAVNLFFPEEKINVISDFKLLPLSDADIEYRYGLFLNVIWKKFDEKWILNSWDILNQPWDHEPFEYIDQLPINMHLEVAPALLLILYKKLLDFSEIDYLGGNTLKKILIYSFSCLKEAVLNKNKDSWFFNQTPEQQIIWARVLLNYQYSELDIHSDLYFTSLKPIDVSDLFKNVIEKKAHNIYESYLKKFPIIDIDLNYAEQELIEDNVNYAKKLEIFVKKELGQFCSENFEVLIKLREKAGEPLKFLENNFITDASDLFNEKWSKYLKGPGYAIPTEGGLEIKVE